jgi:prephenate dehydrogenase
MLGRVIVVGCGLIGGSLVKCLRERKAAVRLAAVDREEVLAAARPYLDGSAPPGSARAAELVAESDTIVLATPVGTIVGDVAWALDNAGPDALVTDTGSVKKPVMDAVARHARRAQFIGGHPMAGREVGGFEASSERLFEHTHWFLVQGGATTPDVSGAQSPDRPNARTLSRALELARAVGAEPAMIDADTHDRAMAYVSHAPQLIASALFGVAARAGVLREAGSGFRDVTRIAGGPSSMWRDIFAANRERIAAALAEILEPLTHARDALARGEEEGLLAVVKLLDDAQAARQASLDPQGFRRKASP